MKTIITKYTLGVLLLLVAVCACKKEEDETTDGSGDSINLERDLALYICFDGENCYDLSGHGFNGVAVGNVNYVADTPNKKGKAAYIDGTDHQFINIPYTIVGDSTNFTVSLWVKDFGTGCLFSNVDGNYAHSPSFFVKSDMNPSIMFCNGSKVDLNTSLAAYQSSGWHMLTCTATQKRNELCLYVDGQRVNSERIYDCKSSGNKMQIGGNADGYYDTWSDPMIVDNFRVYRRCLSTKEVQELYNRER